jgi:hypothetical protein
MKSMMSLSGDDLLLIHKMLEEYVISAEEVNLSTDAVDFLNHLKSVRNKVEFILREGARMSSQAR